MRLVRQEVRQPETDSWWRWTARRAGRHLDWARRDGVARLIEEDQLNPLNRVRTWSEKARWRRQHPDASIGLVVWVVGAQRSGTNLVTRLLDSYPEVELYNENHGAAFTRFELKSDSVLGGLLEGSRHDTVVLKPLCDSERAGALLDEFDEVAPGKAIWVYRNVDARVRSAVAKFGSSNRDVLGEIANNPNSDRWQARGLTRRDHELLGSLDPASLDVESGSALFWYLRNRLFYQQRLDQRDDALLVKYDWLVADPSAHWSSVCEFLGMESTRDVIAAAGIRPAKVQERLDLDPRVRNLCDELETRLDGTLDGQFR